MKTKLIVLSMILSFSLSGMVAQNRQQSTPEQRAKRQTETLTEKLKLNDDQKEKVYDITLKYSKERDTQTGTNADRTKRRNVFLELQKKQEDELKTVFTEDQQKEYEKHLKEMQDRRGNRGNNRRPR